MTNFFKKNWILITIILIAAILRLWKLGSVPPGLTPDEASLGYNAYSILHTGKDEYGRFLPIIFKSFGDYKPGLYVYLDVPFIATLGLNEFSTRLPSAFFGILGVYLVYLIVKKLEMDNWKLPALAAFAAAVNPWLIYFSRGAWEANISLTLTLAGAIFFLKSCQNKKWLIPSAVFFGLTLLTYQGAKLSTAILVFVLFISFRSYFKIKDFFIPGILGVLIILPVLAAFFRGQTFRLNIYSIFSYPRPKESLQVFLKEGNEKIGGVSYYLFHSENLNFARAIFGRLSNAFSGEFLFFEGDYENPVHTAPYQGVLSLSDFVFLPLGIFILLRKKIKGGSLLILLWLILAPLPAALSRDRVSAVRSLNTSIPLIVISALGILSFFEWVKIQKAKLLLFFLALFFYLFSFVYFLDAYFIHVPKHNSELWRYGYKEAMIYLFSNKDKFNNIVFEQSFNQPYIYYLFYDAMINRDQKNIAKYQNQEVLVGSQYVNDVGFVEKIDAVNFKKIDWQVLKKNSGTLVFASPVALPPDYLKDSDLVYEIKYLNGRDVAFEIIKIK